METIMSKIVLFFTSLPKMPGKGSEYLLSSHNARFKRQASSREHTFNFTDFNALSILLKKDWM
jgi:hypothetical protein